MAGPIEFADDVMILLESPDVVRQAEHGGAIVVVELVPIFEFANHRLKN